jgi:hypothetical protein
LACASARIARNTGADRAISFEVALPVIRIGAEGAFRLPHEEESSASALLRLLETGNLHRVAVHAKGCDLSVPRLQVNAAPESTTRAR